MDLGDLAGSPEVEARSSALSFVSGTVVAFLILQLGLESPWAVPAALVFGALAAGLGAYLADRLHSSLAPVLACSLASLVLAIPVGMVLLFVVRTNLPLATPIVFAVVAAASSLAVQRFRRHGG